MTDTKSQYEYKKIEVHHLGRILIREVDRNADSKCLHCGGGRARTISRRKRRGRGARGRGYETIEIMRPLFSYDDTLLTFCNREHFAAYWDGILRANGVHFQRFIHELVSSPDFPPEKLGDKAFLADLMKYAKKRAKG